MVALLLFGAHVNPANGEFFVGTKSVFNKVKIKINHSHAEIDANHTGEVALILHACLANLPRTNRIIQGDFIGFGGDDTYTPNTITYVFDEIIEQTIIVAPHTLYTAENDLRDAIARPLDSAPSDTDTCKFVMPRCWQIDEDFDEVIAFARQMSTTCEFLTDKQSRQVQQQLNSVIRAGLDIDDITLEALAFANQIDVNVLRLWKFSGINQDGHALSLPQQWTESIYRQSSMWWRRLCQNQQLWHVQTS